MFKISCVFCLVYLFSFCDIGCAFYKNDENTNLVISDEVIKKSEDAKCLEDVKIWMDALAKPEPPQWALEMIDSSTKLQAGLFAGNLVDLGHWDECLGVDSGTFIGQHCIVYVKPSVLNKFPGYPRGMLNITVQPWMHHLARFNNGGLFDYLEIGLSYCVPSSCTGKAIKTAIQNVIEQIGIPGFSTEDISIRVDDDFCHTKETEPLSVVEYVAAAIFSFIGLLMVASTLYDMNIRYTGQRSCNIIWLSFSVIYNGEKIFKISPSSTRKTDSISCINGLRTLSILWVVYCHRYFMFVTFPGVFNFNDAFGWMEKYSSTTSTGGSVSVDTFLLLSGFLLTYITFKQLEKTGGKISLLKYYLHRYLRLTPPVAALVLLHCSFFYRLAFGPFSKSEIAKKELRDDCQLYWWAPLLYIQNYYNTDNMCITQSWYLSVDMQLYVIAPLLLIPLFKWPKPTLAFIGVISLATIGINFAITYVNDFTGAISGLDPNRTQMKMLYFPVHTRYGPWLIGMVLGYIMHKTRHKEIRISKMLCLSLWAVTLCLSSAVILGVYRFYRLDWENDVMISSFYQALHRQAWSLVVCWVIFACHNGYGGPVNWFLSWGVWQPFARLSYCIYLLHYQLQTAETVAKRTPLYFSESQMMSHLWSDIGFSFCASLVWSLAFEWPIAGLEQVIFGGGKKRDKPEPEPKQNGDVEQPVLEEIKETTEKISDKELLGKVNEAYDERL